MDKEENKRRLMLTCLKENAENIIQEHGIMKQRCREIVTPNENAHERLNELIDKNKFPEFQVAFRQVYKAVRETQECVKCVKRLKSQMSETATSLRLYQDPSEGVTMADFLAVFLFFF